MDKSNHQQLHESLKYKFWRFVWVKSGKLQRYAGMKLVKMNLDLENSLD